MFFFSFCLLVEQYKLNSNLKTWRLFCELVCVYAYTFELLSASAMVHLLCRLRACWYVHILLFRPFCTDVDVARFFFSHQNIYLFNVLAFTFTLVLNNPLDFNGSYVVDFFWCISPFRSLSLCFATRYKKSKIVCSQWENIGWLNFLHEFRLEHEKRVQQRHTKWLDIFSYRKSSFEFKYSSAIII